MQNTQKKNNKKLISFAGRKKDLNLLFASRKNLGKN